MTKQEILDTGDKTDEELFQSFKDDTWNRVRSLGLALGFAPWNSRLLSSYQKRRLQKLSEDLEKFAREVLGWNFHGKKDQMTLFELDK